MFAARLTLLSFLITAAPHATAQITATERLKFLDANGEADDLFGGAVAIDGDTLAASARRHGSGTVTVLRRSGPSWSLEAVLAPSIGGANFGVDLALDGDTLLVGASGDATAGFNSGAAFVFERTGTVWSEVEKLVASFPQVDAFFGESVALDGGRAVVGAPLETHSGLQWAGAVYVFEHSGSDWLLADRFVDPNPVLQDTFGRVVSLSGDRIAIGSWAHDGSLPFSVNQGAAWVFAYDGASWSQEAFLQPAVLQGSAFFGAAVTIEGSLLLVGALNDNPGGVVSGSVFAFERSGTAWNQTARFAPAGSLGGEDFGQSISLQGVTAVVGAANDFSAGGQGIGVAHVFRKFGATWVEAARLHASDGAGLDRFGTDVALSSGTFLVGSPFDDELGADSGSAYLFRLEASPGEVACPGTGFGWPCPCANTAGFGEGCATSTSHGAALIGTGSASFTADDLVLSVVHMPPNVRGVFLAGTQIPNGGLGATLYDGLKCARGIAETGPGFFTGALGAATLSGPAAGFAATGGGAVIQPGTTVVFQALFRDFIGPCGQGANLSNGFSVTYAP